MGSILCKTIEVKKDDLIKVHNRIDNIHDNINNVHDKIDKVFKIVCPPEEIKKKVELKKDDDMFEIGELEQEEIKKVEIKKPLPKPPRETHIQLAKLKEETETIKNENETLKNELKKKIDKQI